MSFDNISAKGRTSLRIGNSTVLFTIIMITLWFGSSCHDGGSDLRSFPNQTGSMLTFDGLKQGLDIRAAVTLGFDSVVKVVHNTQLLGRVASRVGETYLGYSLFVDYLDDFYFGAGLEDYTIRYLGNVEGTFEVKPHNDGWVFKMKLNGDCHNKQYNNSVACEGFISSNFRNGSFAFGPEVYGGCGKTEYELAWALAEDGSRRIYSKLDEFENLFRMEIDLKPDNSARMEGRIFIGPKFSNYDYEW